MFLTMSKKKIMWTQKILTKNKLLRQYGMGKRNFENVKFRGGELSWQYLAQINLSNADLSFSRLEGIDLTAAKLIEVNLSHADLSHANLY